jgi:hypothetical protein
MKKLIDYRLLDNLTVLSDEAWTIAQLKRKLGSVILC